MKRVSGAPIASIADTPNTFSAIGLKMTIFCSSSTVMIASIDERMMPIMRASLSRLPLGAVRAAARARDQPASAAASDSEATRPAASTTEASVRAPEVASTAV